jgi:predicted small metal-binding protein
MFRTVSCGLLILALSGFTASAESDAECVSRTGDHMYCFHWRKHGLTQSPITPPPVFAPTPPPPSFPPVQQRRRPGSKCEFGILDRDCWDETLKQKPSARRKNDGPRRRP